MLANHTITVVSGLPRSGSSMMMQILDAGGLPVMSDNQRQADENNPLGYYEYEKVKTLKDDSTWIKSCQGRVVKIISALLYYLPMHYTYKVIFMQRDMEEIIRSQNAMLQRLGRDRGKISDQQMAEKFIEHLEKVQQWLQRQKNIDTLYISYNDIIETSLENIERINQFLDRDLKIQGMVKAIRKKLYRQRSTR